MFAREQRVSTDAVTSLVPQSRSLGGCVFVKIFKCATENRYRPVSMSDRELLLSKFRVRLSFGETTPRGDDFLENDNSRLLAILAVYLTCNRDVLLQRSYLSRMGIFTFAIRIVFILCVHERLARALCADWRYLDSLGHKPIIRSDKLCYIILSTSCRV